MAQRTRKRQETTYQTVIPQTRYLGMNVQTNIKLEDGYSNYIGNFDIYAGKDVDHLQSRRGSQFLRKASSPTAYGATAITNRITWDVGSEEYLITQTGTSMNAQPLITIDDPVAIALATGGAFALGSTTQADLFISGDKLYVMHPSGNYVIRWTGSVFVAYPMGLAYPHILAVTSANAGVITGSYTLGIEKVYRVSNVDMMASTPNRKIATTRILATTGTISAKKIQITIQDTELDNDTLWTHLRVWRSKNKNTDNTDPLNPIDAQGNDDELYEEALITKAEIEAGALASVATGSTLPPGNAGTQAGNPGSVYTIELNNADSVLFNMIGIDRIELLPIPACTIGCFCANRIFFSGVQDSALDDASKNNIWYSNYAGTKYAFQYNPLNFVDTGRDGQNMMKLIAFEKDVIGIKEAKTGRLPSGDVNLPYQSLDDRIGVSHKNLAAFIPTVGIVAITNDFGDFRIFGYDLRWTGTLNGMDISLPVRSYTSTLTAATTSFAYINGKVMVFDNNSALCLYVKEGRGWTRATYGTSGAFMLFTFAAGARAAMVGASHHLVECEVSGLDTDVDVTTGLSAAIAVTEISRAFKHEDGRAILEFEYLSVQGYFTTGTVNAIVFANLVTWPDKASPTSYPFTPDGQVAGATYLNLAYREYRLYVPPSVIGTLKWCPLAANSLAFRIIAAAPCTIQSKELHCLVDENGMGWGAFDPHQMFPSTNTDPSWAQ